MPRASPDLNRTVSVLSSKPYLDNRLRVIKWSISWLTAHSCSYSTQAALVAQKPILKSYSYHLYWILNKENNIKHYYDYLNKSIFLEPFFLNTSNILLPWLVDAWINCIFGVSLPHTFTLSFSCFSFKIKFL